MTILLDDVEINVESVNQVDVSVELVIPEVTVEVVSPVDLSVDVVGVGPPGPPGAMGAGVPLGGTTGQVLAKNSNVSYDTLWQNPPSGGGSGDWADITNKPTTFPPTDHDTDHDDRFSLLAHTHTYAAVEHDTAHDDRFSLLAHTHASHADSDHDDRFSLLAHAHTAPTWTEVTGKPTTFTPIEHDADHSDAFSATGHTHAAHADTDHDDRFSLLAHAHTPGIAPTISLTAPTQLSQVTVVDDGSATSGWPDRLMFRYHHLGGSAIPTGWFNEYGEIRAQPAKANTVPFRLFTKDQPASAAHTVNMFEIQDDRTTRTNIVTIDTAGNISTTATPSAGTHLVTKTLLDNHTHAAYAAVEHDSAHDDRFSLLAHTHAAHADSDHDDRFSLLAHTHAAPDWSVITNKPATFTPTVQALDWLSDVATTGADANEVLTFNGTSWVPQAPASGGAVDWADITSKPTTFAPTAHDADHASAYSATGHTHAVHADTDHDDRFSLLAHTHADHADTDHDDRFALRTVSIATTSPLSGGGDLTANRTLTIANDSVTNTHLALMAASTIKGNNTGSTAGPADLTVAQARSMVASGAGALFGFDFDTTTTAGPAATRLRLNNATPASATIVYVTYTSKDGADLKTRLLAGTAGDRLFIQDRANSANYRVYELTGTPTDGTTYATCNVVHRSGGGSLWANSTEIIAGFTSPPITVGTTAPSSPLTNDLWIDTT